MLIYLLPYLTLRRYQQRTSAPSGPTALQPAGVFPLSLWFPKAFWKLLLTCFGKSVICLQCGKIILFFCHCSGYTHPHMLESWEMAWFRQFSEITEGCLWKWKQLSGNHREKTLTFQNTSVFIRFGKQTSIFHFLGLLSFLFTNSVMFLVLRIRER